jgi:hypothetical protein
LSTTNRKPRWAFGLMLLALAADLANLGRLVHGPWPAVFWAPYAIAAACTAGLLLWQAGEKSRRALWILLALALFLITVVSDGTDVSLWVALAVGTSLPHPLMRRRIASGVFWLLHIAVQSTLLPLHGPSPYLVYALLAGTGLLGWASWHFGARALPTARALS